MLRRQIQSYFLILFLLFSTTIIAEENTDLAIRLTNTRVANQGLWNVYFFGFNNLDYKIPNPDLKSKGLYYSFGLEMHEISFDKATRLKYNFEFLGELIYLIGSGIRRNSLTDEDDRYSNPTVFTSVLVDFMTTSNIYVGEKIAFGGGLALNDLFLTFNKQSFDGAINDIPSYEYGWFFGPAIHFDALISKSITFHADVYRSFGLYFYRGEEFEKAGQSKRPFGFWRSSAMILHHSGLMTGVKYSHVVNQTSFDLSPARLNFFIGLRNKMYKYNGETYKDDPRHNINKVTF